MKIDIQILAAYLAVINFCALFVYGYDKYMAVMHKRRTPEKFLLTAAVIGGSLGALAGMLIFRHKTLHKKFTVCVPLMLFIHIILLLVLYNNGIIA